MKALMRKERGLFAAEWIDYGQRQAPDMGGEALLSCRFDVREGVWVDAGVGIITTQVRLGEDPDMLDTLLDKLLDRFEDFFPEIADTKALLEFKERLHWFGPEMAEEY